MALGRERKGNLKTMDDGKPTAGKAEAVLEGGDGEEDVVAPESRKRRSPSPPAEHLPEEATSSNLKEGEADIEQQLAAASEEQEQQKPAPVKRSPPPPPPPFPRPAVIRKSPPPPPPSSSSTSSRPHHPHAASIYPATPASNPAVAPMRRTSGSAKKMAVTTPNPVVSGGGSSVTPASGGKPQRGLRHFSIMVCKHVEQMGTTTYNQVADELVSQTIAERKAAGAQKGKFDEKNIRRRVYDALNVLLAMDIISKDKKDIIWKGLPRPASDPAPDEAAAAKTEEEDKEQANEEEQEEEDTPPPPPSSPPKPIYTDEAEYDEHEFAAMQREREYLEAEVARKQEALREILVQQVCFRNLVMRNQKREYPRHGGPHKPPPADEKIPLPFIISNTRPSAVVQCDMNKEKTDVMFEFDSPFEINDDNTILKRMEMDKTTVHALQGMLPEVMFDYCRDTGILETVLLPGEDPNNAARAPHFRAYDRSQRQYHHRY